MISAPTGRRNAFLQKKKMRRWPTNMIVIRIIIRFHRSCVINLIMNIAIIRIVTSKPLYFISYALFPDFFLILSVFLVFTLVSFFYVSSRIFFRSSLIFFSCFFSVYQVLYSVIRCKRDSKKKKKKKKMWCVVSAMSSRSNQTSLRQARRKSMDWLDCISVYGSENSHVETYSKSQWL